MQKMKKTYKNSDYIHSPENEKKPEEIQRHCLACGRAFVAKGPFIRLCPQHRNGDVHSIW